MDRAEISPAFSPLGERLALQESFAERPGIRQQGAFMPTLRLAAKTVSSHGELLDESPADCLQPRLVRIIEGRTTSYQRCRAFNEAVRRHGRVLSRGAAGGE